jgi:hypothetical protein
MSFDKDGNFHGPDDCGYSKSLPAVFPDDVELAERAIPIVATWKYRQYMTAHHYVMAYPQYATMLRDCIYFPTVPPRLLAMYPKIELTTRLLVWDHGRGFRVEGHKESVVAAF